MNSGAEYDLAVIGGGVNGCGIARDAQGRGLRVVLAEMGDLAGATSSASTKLIHGGLRYLEYYEFRLVHEALVEREVLLRAAPHIVWPLRFVLPHHEGLRPWPIIRLGLFLYDHLGGRKILPGTRSLDLSRDAAGKGLKPRFRRAFEYSDCWVEDSRLVVLNAQDAFARGADIRTRTKCTAARRVQGKWRLTLQDERTGATGDVVARAVVNATGPWVSQVLTGVAGLDGGHRTRMVKGSHIVVDRLFDHDRAYIFQNADGRICFALPYETDFTLIGTTDLDYRGDPRDAEITVAETDYLLQAVGEYLAQPIDRSRIRWSYSGVRPLYDDGVSKAQEATRDYVLRLDAPDDGAPFLSVFGGKITTYRRLAEHALEQLGRFFPGMGRPWTAAASLPGGDFGHAEVPRRIADLRVSYPFLSQAQAQRLFRAYGTRCGAVLGRARDMADLGRDFGAGLSEREVEYLMQEEWAQCAEDVLWRRTRLGLRLDAAAGAVLDEFMQARRRAPGWVAMRG